MLLLSKWWAVEQICGVIVYSAIFPLVLHRYSIGRSLAWLVLIQIAVYFALVYAYDRSGKDIFNLPQAKQMFREAFDWKEHHERRRAWASRAMLFAFSSYKCMPPMVLLLMRRGDRKGHPLDETAILLLAIALSTAYSSLLSLGYKVFGDILLILVCLFVIYLVVRFRMVRRKRSMQKSAVQPPSRF